MPTHVDWPRLIDEILLAGLADFAGRSSGDVEGVYLTGSYVRGSWNPERPNVNVYFFAAKGRAARVRWELGKIFVDLRRELRVQEVDLVIDCHPYTISQRDPAWRDRRCLTLTTKVFAAEQAEDRYGVSTTIGLGWHTTHRVLFGRADMLSVFGRPPARDRRWLHGAHQALSHYRNILDHLPWAVSCSPRLLEESCRYAEEALRDGVHIALTDAELAAGRNIEILHEWAQVGRAFYLDRYGEDGVTACDIVDRLKSELNAGRCAQDTAERAWLDALAVWDVVWRGYRDVATHMDAPPELLRVTTWL